MKQGWGDVGGVSWTLTKEDVEKILKDLGIEVVKEDARGDLSALCPFHSDRKPSWSISTAKPGNPSGCWSCGARARTILTLITACRGGGTERAKTYLRQFTDVDRAQIRGPSIIRRPTLEADVPMDEAVLLALGRCREDCMLTRGFPGKFLDAQGVRYDKEKRRVVVPIRTAKGQLAGLIGRAATDAVQPKYYFYDGIQKSRYLLGEQHIADDDGLIIVEGVFDYLRCVQYGYLSTVALMGAQVSAIQADKLRKIGARRYTLMLDNDEAGKAGTLRLIEALRGSAPIFVASYPEDCKDPGDMDEGQMTFALKTAKPVWLGKKKEVRKWQRRQ